MMQAALQTASQPLNRLDRRVLRANLRLASEASRFSVTFALEEALRLATLPGEDEGRIYIFNKVSFRGLPAHGDRRIWMDRVQSTLAAVAATAVPGSHPGAATANAVYFHNVEHALETLLSAVLHCLPSTPGAAAAAAPWFVASFLGLPVTSKAIEPPQLLEALLLRLHPPAMPLPAGAALLLSTVTNVGAIRLLAAIPETTLRSWLADIAPPPSTLQATQDAPAPGLPSTVCVMLQDAASHFGWRAPATLWLASQAIAATYPSTPHGELNRRARAVLREQDRRVTQNVSPPTPALSRAQRTHSVEGADRSLTAADHNPAALLAHAAPAAVQEAPLVPERQHAPVLPAPAPDMLGESTSSAGLYFLLHVLRHLGIATTLKDNPDLAEANLPAHILFTLALHCGVRISDPILRPLALADSAFTLSAKTIAGFSSTAFPPHLSNEPGSTTLSIAGSTADGLLQLWTRAVRRWCIQNARITVRTLMHRPGHLWLTRTDLDVTLPFTATDVRIRRAGLDLDPLWLPWFGPTGRVVRFHYGNSSSISGAA